MSGIAEDGRSRRASTSTRWSDPRYSALAELSADLRDRALESLGFSRAPEPDLAGLRALYRAWGERVPFDNLRKLIALREEAPGPFPGGRAGDFFAAWLEHGTGGTCWPGSNALFALADACGFAARRVAGSMLDTGAVTHGSVKVAIEGRDWLVDSSMLTGEPLPLGDGVHVGCDPLVPFEVEREGTEHVVWCRFPQSEAYLPCRLLVDPADLALYLERYEASRAKSPFNVRLCARRNRPGVVVAVIGRTRHERTAAGLESRDLSRDELLECLTGELGYSAAIVDRWARSGALEDSLAPPAEPSPPPPDRLPPSRRRAGSESPSG